MTDFLGSAIRARDGLLDGLVGAKGTLNAGPAAGKAANGDLAAELRLSLNKLQAAAMNEAGTAVDYAALRRSPAYAAFRAHDLARLRAFRPGELPNGAAQRAFWINLYNLLVLDAVIVGDVQQSVTEGRLGQLAFFRRAAYTVDGRRVSLEDIEHGILRANRGSPFLPGPHFHAADPRRAWSLPLDPRLHFALNCGGVSCPPIRAYTAEQLDAQLDLAARNFIGSTVQIVPERGEVQVSQLLRWYAADFGGRVGVLDFVIAHLPAADGRRAWLREQHGPRLRYSPYDWSLNSL